MTTLLKKVKHLIPSLSVFALVAQQLCLCLLLCNLYHGNFSEKSDVDYASKSISQEISVPNDIPCGEEAHIETCAKERLSLPIVKTDFVIPEIPRFLDLFQSYHREITYSVIENPNLREKIFLKLHAFRC